MNEWSTVGGIHYWEPSPGNRYECARVGAKGKRFWARHNGTYLGTRQIRVFMGTLERCKAICEEHHRDRQKKTG